VVGEIKELVRRFKTDYIYFYDDLFYRRQEKAETDRSVGDGEGIHKK